MNFMPKCQKLMLFIPPFPSYKFYNFLYRLWTLQFLSNILLVKKKEWGNRPCINLKALNKIIPHKHFKMKDFLRLKYLFEENFFSKTDLKDVYFSVPLCVTSKNFVRFAWLGNLHQFLCLCFILGPAPRIFSKLLKIPILRRLNIRLVKYLDDILLVQTTLEKIFMSRKKWFLCFNIWVFS